jgi:hypothetical protein
VPVCGHCDWQENGGPICTALNDQIGVRIVPDGYGGAIIVWLDERNGLKDIYAQRIDQAGRPQWASGGVPICVANSTQNNMEVTADGYGGAIITWEDYRLLLFSKVYAQRVNASGNVYWTTNGVSICSGAGDQLLPCIASDGAGGAIIAWSDERTGYLDIYINRVNSSGSVLWGASGAPMCTATRGQTRPEIAADGAGGAVLVWQDGRPETMDFQIYAQRVNENGNVLWGVADGTPVCTSINDQDFPQIISDGNYGAIITWRDNRNGTDRHILAQRIDQMGTALWTANGVNICWTTGYTQGIPAMISDDAGGAIITWHDERWAGSSFDIYAQRVDSDGVVHWLSNGRVICWADNSQYSPTLAPDGMGGAIITWFDAREGGSNYDLYAQYIDADENWRWADNGVPISVESYRQEYPRVISNGVGGAIIAWQDSRSGTDYDVYAQRINSVGETNLAPIIDFVRDIPHDEGGKVAVAWARSALDEEYVELITVYSVWRALPHEVIQALPVGFETVRPEDVVAPDFSGPAIRATTFGSMLQYWEWVGNVASHRLSSYSYAAATLFDSTAATDAYHSFFVSAHTSDPYAYWDSAPDSGYSVDNLAPCPPMCLAGEQSFEPIGLDLTWAPNTELDLDFYAIYRGTDPGFTPDPGNLLTTTCDTCYFDGDWTWDSDYCYKATAVDIHGNESEYALLCSENITGEETPVIPAANYLEQNYPNPFNPSTRITFGLQAPAFVRLRIYDAAGRLVRVLVEEHRDAGTYSEIWNGLDGNGRTVASGVYFYGLTAGRFKETKKMVLLR